MYLVVPPGGRIPDTRRIELGPQPLTIGRNEGCDIRVDVPGVDDEHAKISEVALVALGPDCAVGDVPLEPGHRRLVMPGDEIQIGSIVVALEGHDPSLIPPPPDTAGGPSDGTVRHTAPMPGVTPASQLPRVRVVEGTTFGDELVLREENHEYVIGRSPKADLVLDDREVSREHVKLMRKGFQVFIRDQSSTRGSWLGRSAVYTGSTVEWTRPRMLRVGVTVLSLELPESVRRAAPGAQASAPMTPPPRARVGHGPSSSSLLGGGPASVPGSVPGSVPDPSIHEASTRKLPPYQLDPTPTPAHAGSYGGPAPASGGGPDATPAFGSGGYTPAPVPSSPVITSGAGGAAAIPSEPLALGRNLGPLPAPSNARKAWKRSGPTIGKVSGLILLALAGLAILGVLFVVFSLLE